MTNSQSVQSSIDELQNYFRNQTELSDLHTHLLGMGDDAFWVGKNFDERNCFADQRKIP